MKTLHPSMRALTRACLCLACALAFSVFTSAALQDVASEALADGAEPSDPAATEEHPAHDTIMLRLRSGNILWGGIESHDPEALFFHRLDTGGVVRLPWSFLDPEQERGLRLRFGYVDLEADEILIRAERIVLKDGTEIVGVIESRTDDYLNVRTGGVIQPVPKRSISGGSTIVEVPALDVYSREQLYQARALELADRLILDGTPGAEAHFELARYSERLFDYAHAAEHYGYVAKLDPTYEPELVPGALARSEAKAALQEQVDFLAEIDHHRARKNYDKALAGLAAFPELYPDSPLLEDFNKLADRVARYQERDLREQVVKRLHYWTVRLARDAARKAENFEEVVAYAGEPMTEELLVKVQVDLQKYAPDIEPEVVRQLWEERSKRGRPRRASYGLGTWLLGEERALYDPKQDEEERKEQEKKLVKGTQDEARKKLEERLDRYFKNQSLAKKAKASGGEEDGEDPNAFWARWNYASRSQWVLAYYVENSGLFNVERVRFENCRECGGTGARQILYTGGAIEGSRAGTQLVACPTCHTIRVVRRISFR